MWAIFLLGLIQGKIPLDFEFRIEGVDSDLFENLDQVIADYLGVPLDSLEFLDYEEAVPTLEPTETPTKMPTNVPTQIPSENPTQWPTETPTQRPTITPTLLPTVSPTVSPTVLPTLSPTENPSPLPTITPTEIPTRAPTERPTEMPSHSPTSAPTHGPTEIPSEMPTPQPSENPTLSTESPTGAPTINPTEGPTATPTQFPSQTPTSTPVARRFKPVRWRLSSDDQYTLTYTICVEDRAAADALINYINEKENPETELAEAIAAELGLDPDEVSAKPTAVEYMEDSQCYGNTNTVVEGSNNNVVGLVVGITVVIFVIAAVFIISYGKYYQRAETYRFEKYAEEEDGIETLRWTRKKSNRSNIPN